MFWKEVTRIRKSTSGKEEGVKTKDATLLVERAVVDRRSTVYFEGFLSVDEIGGGSCKRSKVQNTRE